ncbi:alpha-acetolactate decarboxylase [Lactobacillus nasalidis]|uniref:Alpha-acetolactate decarboxylase n=1 Tax=Lactobacillus nasalidis TaxID=2797258 RepID=A0ABQ3W914_9LACO|nr:acetolactate decarboxylase [Lactobacillus nasalidis]GHV97213.1 alpha-acetolactate decarboxylase [Lactobacillus nasalidis]GHV98864.1 alpha-acetolactate decarboxylase [Lactobacillus nasalidis]GHW02157.1 alpha-acetolactate decarboxylase [Lactobacillus nasalidis]
MSKETTIFQHGTLAMLVAGLFDGTMTVKDLLEHGDSGIGTCSGLDGEMVILNGRAYTIRRDGSVEELSPETTVPFACVHFDQPASGQKLSGLSLPELEAFLMKQGMTNIFYAVKLTGRFAKMKTRTVFKQEKPYPGLNEVADQQAVFEGKDTAGSLIGYYAPGLYQGIASSGFHLHYLSSDHALGGHVLDLALEEGELSLQSFADFRLHLPVENTDFMQQAFDLDRLSEQIQQAEH